MLNYKRFLLFKYRYSIKLLISKSNLMGIFQTPNFFSTLLKKAKSLIMEDDKTNPEQQVLKQENQPEVTSPDFKNDSLQSAAEKITFRNALPAIFNGLGIGLLLGILLGLSISPVVSGVVATLSSLLAVLIGLNEKYIDTLKSLRIGAFGLFAVAGILLGLYIRANDPLSPSLNERKKEFEELGFNEQEIKFLITGIMQADSSKMLRRANTLYTSKVNVGACDILSTTKEDTPVNEIVNTFIMAGDTWKEFAETFKNDLPENILGKALLTMKDCFCEDASAGIITMTNLDRIRKIKSGDSLAHIEQEFNSSGIGWQKITKAVSSQFPENERKSIYLSIIKVLSHD